MPFQVRSMRRALLIAFAYTSMLPGYVAACDEAAGRIAELRETLARSGSNDVIVIAHRACWEKAPENSLAAIEACVDLGVDMVELDVRRTADGVLVLMHDERVDRTTNGSGAVSDLTFEQIKRLRLREGVGGEDAAMTSLAVPTFEQAMLAAKGRILVNLDAKADVYTDAFDTLTATDTADHIIMKKRVDRASVPLSSTPPFDQVLSMPIIDQAAGEARPIIERQLIGEPVAVELIFTTLAYSRDAAEDLTARGIRVWVNTLHPELSAGLTDREAVEDPDAVWGTFLDLGFTMIQTDRPSELIAYLKSLDRRSTPPKNNGEYPNMQTPAALQVTGQ